MGDVLIHDEDYGQVDVTDFGDDPCHPVGVQDVQFGDIVTRISERVTEEVAAQIVASQMLGGGSGSGRPPTEPPTRTFLGNDAKSWGGWALKAGLAGATAIAAWVMVVNDAIDERPTRPEVTNAAAKAVDSHEEHGDHPRLERLLEAHGEQLKALSDVQIRQTTILETNAETMREIRVDLRARDRRRR